MQILGVSKGMQRPNKCFCKSKKQTNTSSRVRPTVDSDSSSMFSFFLFVPIFTSFFCSSPRVFRENQTALCASTAPRLQGLCFEVVEFFSQSLDLKTSAEWGSKRALEKHHQVLHQVLHQVRHLGILLEKSFLVVLAEAC